MQTEKIRIVIASTLKPIDDTRMFEKMGISLADSGNYEVYIVGFNASKPIAGPDIHFIPLRPFKRLSIRRLLAAWTIFQIVCKIKPSIFIVGTHELLFPAVFFKLRFRKKILYDVRENYFRNILFIPSFNLFLRPLLAVYVRTKEYCLAPFIDHFILAERGYEQELGFCGNTKTILENKIRQPIASPSRPKMDAGDRPIRLLFSGTLARSTGVLEAIKLAKELHAVEPRVRLTIIGYCALDQTLRAIKTAIQEADFIELIGGGSLVPHGQIIQAIQEADAAIISYPQNPSTFNAVPTKLFECLGYKLPILMTEHPAWLAYCIPYNACIPVDINAIDASSIVSQLKTREFYTKSPENIFWASEEKKLLHLVETLING